MTKLTDMTDLIFFTLSLITAGLLGFIAGAIFGVSRPHDKEHD